MSFQLYVGNYPTNFSRKDVADIFRDFDGIQLGKCVTKEKKCYSFLFCKDINQLVDVVREKNNAFVSGRKLVVRASDTKLQEYVELLLRETKDQVEISRGNDADETPQKIQNVNSYESPGEKDKLDSPTFVPLQVLRNKTLNTRLKVSDEQYDKNSFHSSCSAGSCNDDKYESVTASPESSYYSPYQDDISELIWLSVTNFPLGTSKRALYRLFSDYNPVDVQMICNEARKDKTITEAYVCFLNRETADDVILNFDNTLFHGRILLVNDTQDLTVMNELLNVLHL